MSQPTDTAVLLVNLGSPASCSARDIRRFLREFLSDPRVVDLPRALWLPILWGFILPFRPRRLVEKYRSIWRDGDAPIRAITRQQVIGLQLVLDQRYGSRRPQVAFAMTYGAPSIAATLEGLLADGIRRLLVLPLFPQYSAATTGAVFDAIATALKSQPDLPELRFVRDYHAHSLYIDALAASLGDWLARADRGRLLFSFHGIPVSQVEAGDPYPEACLATAALVAEKLALAADEWQVTFQSRFGRAPWVEPYTDETLRALAMAGSDSVTLVCPGFAADCLETLEEIDQQNRELFLSSGGREYAYVPALNDSPAHMRLLDAIVAEHLGDWCL